MFSNSVKSFSLSSLMTTILLLALAMTPISTQAQTGDLTVTLEPADAVAAGAKWRRAGTTTWFDSGTTETGLSAGNVMIQFKPVMGWVKPLNQFATIADAQNTTTSGSYVECNGSVITWGSNTYGQCNVPSPNLDFVQVSSGNYHSAGLKSDGSIVTWGMNENGQCDVPEPNSDFIAVDAGTRHTLGLKSDGSIVAWGLNDAGQCNVPEPNSGFIAVAGGYKHSIGLKADGTIVEWGNHYSTNLIPLTNNHDFVEIRAGYDHSLALRADGSIAAWGYNGYHECDIPAPNSGFVAIGVGVIDSFGLKANGSVVAWGYNTEGQCNVPTPNSGYQAVSGGRYHSIGLKTDGSLVAWGSNTYGQCNVPAPNSGFVTNEAGYIHNAAIKPGLGLLTVNIEPQGVIDAGARWSIDGGTTWYNSGESIPDIESAGSFTIVYKDVFGWTTPDTQVASITPGTTNTVTATYVAFPPASISVNIEPTDAVTAGAQWRRAGTETWLDSGATDSNLQSGDYEIEFKNIVGWTTPDNQVTTLDWGDSVTLTGTYEAIPVSSLSVTIDPAEAVTDGAQWSIDGGVTWQDSGSLLDVYIGDYTVEFKDLTWWKTPVSQNMTVTADNTTSVSATYEPQGAVSVTIEPAEVVSAGAQWSIDGGSTWQNTGATLTDLAIGNYTLSFNEINGWTTPNNQDIEITLAQETTTTGTYVALPPGALSVTIEPAEAVAAGAQWRRAGTQTWFDSGATETDLPGSDFMIEFKPLLGWQKPINQIVTIDYDRTTSASGTYVVSKGSAIAWGLNDSGQCDVPSPNLEFVQISCGNSHSVGLKADGSIVAWGGNVNGQCDVPEPNIDFIAVSAGLHHTLGLKSDGSIMAWGLNDSGQCDVPEPNTGFVAVAGGYKHSLGLKADGTVVEWGTHYNNFYLVSLTNNSDFVDIRADYDHSLALRADGSIAAWGYNRYNQCNVPAPNSGFVAIAIGSLSSFGLKADGSIVAWGYNADGQCDVPEPNSDFKAIAGGHDHGMGLKINGSIVTWGTDTAGQRIVPPNNIGYIAIEAGYRHSLALKTGLGLLTVNIEPQAAIDAGGQWSVDGGTTWLDSGYEMPLDPSDYTVMFKETTNWITPDIRSVSVVADQITSISVNMEILPTFGCDISSLSTTCDEGQIVPDQTIHVWNSEGGNLNYTVAVSPAETTWLSVSPESGTSTGESDPITVSYDTAGLASGIYEAMITISDPDALNNPIEVPVVLSVGLNKILAGDGEVVDAFGKPIAISGNTAVIGALQDCPDGYTGSYFGTVYIFVYLEGVWTQQAKLVSPQPREYEWFGNSVSISGDTLIIGTSDNPGYAYIYHRTNGIWTLQAQLSADEGADQYQFGNSVSISGDTAVIGSNLDDDFGESSGAAYVFSRTNGVWTKEAKLTASDAAAADNFGWSVSISGETIIAGSSWNDDAGSKSGSAYIFTRSNGIWTQQAKLTSSDAEAGDEFGDGVLISDDTALVCALGDDDGGDFSSAVYFFSRSEGVWTQQVKMSTANPGIYDFFGYGPNTMALSGDTAIIAARNDDSVLSNSGSAYVYTRSYGNWSFKEKLISPEPKINGRFGESVAIENNTALIYDGPLSTLSGVYVFTLDYDPPTVAITEPTSDPTWTVTESPTISLAGTASNIGSGLASITWANDRGGSGIATGTENWSVSDIPLQMGDNIITVTATDEEGNLNTDVLTVILPPASISVSISPTEAVNAGAQWSIDGGATWQTSGVLISGLSAGDYNVQFKTIDGWLLPESQVVTVVDGQITEISASYLRQPLDASVVWVDFNYTGEEWGSEIQPYNTLAEGVMAVASGGTIRVKTGASGTGIRITTPMRIDASGGPVVIGRSTISTNKVANPGDSTDNSKDNEKLPGDLEDLLNQKNAVIEWYRYE